MFKENTLDHKSISKKKKPNIGPGLRVVEDS